jgi:LacI family transcriptional regulator
MANVSTATVSRVLSGNRPVSSDIRDRVEAAARELGYVPNHFGSALRRRESATVGVLVPRITNPFYPLVLEELEAAAQDIEFHVLIAVSGYDVDTERQRLREFVARNVDACVVVPASWARSGEAIRATHEVVPVIQFDGQSEGAHVPHIGMDNAHAVTALVEHLLERGRRSLVFLGGGLATSPDLERRRAFREIAGRMGDRARFAEIPGDDYSFETGRRAADELVRGELRPDAVIASNDMIALGCIEGLERLGVHVPDDMAVCGIDDIGFSGLFRPTLTTVRQPLAEMSRVALNQLRLDADGDTGPPGSTRFTGSLVVRMSSTST